MVSLFKKYTVSEGFSGGGTYENSITQDSKREHLDRRQRQGY